MQSRNQREGRYIPGWCINPDYKRTLDAKGNRVQKIRAGKHCDIKEMRSKELGKAYLRTYREGAFE